MKRKIKVAKAAEIFLVLILSIANLETYRRFEPSKAAAAAILSCAAFLVALCDTEPIGIPSALKGRDS